jgi:hypothetical protein
VTLPVLASAPDAEATCPKCGEGLYFVLGIRGPERWKHCRTGVTPCEPLCAKCGKRGIFKIGKHNIGGDGFNTFYLDHWECGACARETCRIEAT